MDKYIKDIVKRLQELEVARDTPDEQFEDDVPY